MCDSLYQPLDDGYIRLLSFLDDTGYACEMKPFKLRTAPRYIALSYTWGKASYSKGRRSDLQYSMTLNTQCFPVEQNLHDALGHLGKRVRRHECFFWVDAICINQKDFDERASQVRQMTTIYEQSYRIFAWLGVPFSKTETKLAVKMMHDFHIHLRDGLAEYSDNIDLVLATINLNHPCFPIRSDSSAWTAWDGIAEMFNQPYFHRVWIYQEATTPRPIDFFCGIFQFDETLLSATITFAMMFSNFPGFNNRFIEAVGHGSSVGSISSARNARQKGMKTSLVELMTQVRKAACTNPMDKVFAPLGLARDMPVGRIDVDYTKTADRLFLDVARYLITDSGFGLEALGLVYTPSQATTNKYLSETFVPSAPSWVPDWRQRVNLSRITSSKILTVDSQPLYNAWPGSQVQIRFSDREMELVGCIVQHLGIKTMMQVFEQPGAPWDAPRTWHDTLVADPDSTDGLEAAINRAIVGDRSVAVRSKKENDFARTFKRGGSVDWAIVNVPREGLDQSLLGELENMSAVMSDVCFGRRMAVFTNGSVGILPAATVPTDKIAAFRGGRSLYVLRGVSHTTGTYNFVGECYVDGHMDGELVKRWRQVNEPCQTLKLV